MRRYLLKRTVMNVFLLLVLSALVYLLIRSMPGDYVKNTIAGNPKLSSAAKNAMLLHYGLNDGVLAGYGKWLWNVLHGEFGTSFLYQIPVAQVIGKTIGVTLFLSLSAFFWEILLSLLLGMAAAASRSGRLEKVASALAICSVSLPSFFFAALLQKLFAIQLPLFPLSGLVNVRAVDTGIFHLLDMLWHMVLPVAVLVMTGIGPYLKLIQTSTAEVLRSDYVLAARARGLSNRRVLLRHVLPNTMVPLLSMVSANIPALLTRTLIAEQIFAINGLGYTAFAALKMADIPLIMGFTLFLAAITVFSILLTDLLYRFADPRIRLEGRRSV